MKYSSIVRGRETTKTISQIIKRDLEIKGLFGNLYKILWC